MKHFVKIMCLTMAFLSLICLVCACGGGSGKNYVFVSSGVTLEAGAAVGNKLDSLGTPKNYSESGSCGGIPGMDKVYVYGGFTVYTTPGKKGDVIAKVELTDDSVKTPEGLAIGSDRKAVTDALGTGENVGGNLVYNGSAVKLTFVMRDDKVTNIQYAMK